MKITYTSDFDAAHRLSDYMGKCHQLHGHRYEYTVSIEGFAVKNGMVLDYSVIKSICKSQIENIFDHKTILKVDDPVNAPLIKHSLIHSLGVVTVPYNPTAENIVRDIFWRMHHLLKDQHKIEFWSVTLKETPKTSAIYTLEDYTSDYSRKDRLQLEYFVEKNEGSSPSKENKEKIQ